MRTEADRPTSIDTTEMFTINDEPTEEDVAVIQNVNPSWFESPVERMGTSGGTAPFFKLTLTDKGLEAIAARKPGQKIDKHYYIGKDLSHAEDEKDFYAELLEIRSRNNIETAAMDNKITKRDVTEGIGLLEPYMFDYLGILRTKVNDWVDDSDDDENEEEEDPHYDLLVIGNLRRGCNSYRMMDLKIGEKTACGGWKGKSHFRAMKHHFMDGITNSVLEGYRLCGFNGTPKVIDSMDPLLDILVEEDIKSGAFSKSDLISKSDTSLNSHISEEVSALGDISEEQPIQGDISRKRDRSGKGDSSVKRDRSGKGDRSIKVDISGRGLSRQRSVVALMLNRRRANEKSESKIERERESILSTRSTDSFADSTKKTFEAFKERQGQAISEWENIIKTGRVKEYVTTTWGAKIKKCKLEQAESFMFKKMCGTNAFRYFFDLHQDETETIDRDCYLPAEVAEIIAHEFMSQLIGLSAACHKVEVPQKWIGSSVAVAYDCNFFPRRGTSEGDHRDREAEIRSKVICKIFDWGRSELLTDAKYENLSSHGRHDRERYWDMYKEGIDRLSYNATRFYYHQFTTSTKWTHVTIEVMDFDSMSSDNYIGKIVIPLPDLSNTRARKSLAKVKTYKIKGILASSFRSSLNCSINWVDFPADSRLVGAWRVTIKRAKNLPPMDVGQLLYTSDAYCVVTANSDSGQHFHQQTCIKARSKFPLWCETIDIPVCRTSNNSSLKSAFIANGISSIEDQDMPEFFKWNKHNPNHRIEKWWRNAVEGKDMSKFRESTKRWKILGMTDLFRPLNEKDECASKEKPKKWTKSLKGKARIFNRDKVKVLDDDTKRPHSRWRPQGKLNFLK